MGLMLGNGCRLWTAHRLWGVRLTSGLWGSLVLCLLVALNDETILARRVPDNTLLTIGINIAVSSLHCSIIQTSLFTETLACWSATGVVAELVVALQRWTNFDIM